MRLVDFLLLCLGLTALSCLRRIEACCHLYPDFPDGCSIISLCIFPNKSTYTQNAIPAYSHETITGLAELPSHGMFCDPALFEQGEE